MRDLLRTSTTDPIRVDWLRVPESWRGRVGITIAPGKQGDSVFGGGWARDLDDDLAHLRDVYDIDRLVCLLGDAELRMLGIERLPESASAKGFVFHQFAIRDVDVPDRDAPLRELVRSIVAAAADGENVAIHCRGGLGRSGVVGGCVLIAGGYSPDAALAALREARGDHCPETTEQREYIRSFRPA